MVNRGSKIRKRTLPVERHKNECEPKHIPIGPKYPIKSASFQFFTTPGMALYSMKTPGILLKNSTRKPSPMSLGIVSPVSSGRCISFQGTTAPMYMKPPKFRTTSKHEFTSSLRRSDSSRYSPSQFSALPATKHASRSSVPTRPHVPRVKSWFWFESQSWWCGRGTKYFVELVNLRPKRLGIADKTQSQLSAWKIIRQQE